MLPMSKGEYRWVSGQMASFVTGLVSVVIAVFKVTTLESPSLSGCNSLLMATYKVVDVRRWLEQVSRNWSHLTGDATWRWIVGVVDGE